uniref:Surface layer protein n=1 Tax=Aeromonas hydrophila TaxID=644 RepID=C9E459_AERHY|nr:surface layer protein [Aeromonas hydrophila]
MILMKKTLIALAVAGLSFNAAAVNLDTGAGVSKFASEIKVDGAAGTTLGTAAGAAMNAVSKLGFSISTGNKRYIRYDVTGGSLAGVAVADLTLVGGTPVAVVAADSSFVISQTAADGSFVIVEVVAKKDIPADAVMTSKADGRVNVKNKNGVAISYRLFETALDAVANDPAKTLAKANGQLLTFSPAILAKVEKKGSADKIDVTESSMKFVTNANVKATDTILGQVSITADVNTLLANGTPVAATSDILNASKLVVNGDFSAGAVDADNKLVLGTVKLNAANATKVEAAKAELAVADAGIGAAAPAGNISYFVGGKAPIAPQSVTATFVPVVKAGYELADVNLGEIGVLNKNGSTKEANLVLAPDTSYTNLVRISNTSNIAGKFFVTAYADDGKSVSFALSDVAGQPAVLDAGASTTQMKVADIYAAAQAKGLALTGDKKLRLKVEGEVASLSLQNYTVSKDGNALNTMNAF